MPRTPVIVFCLIACLALACNAKPAQVKDDPSWRWPQAATDDPVAKPEEPKATEVALGDDLLELAGKDAAQRRQVAGAVDDRTWEPASAARLPEGSGVSAGADEGDSPGGGAATSGDEPSPAGDGEGPVTDGAGDESPADGESQAADASVAADPPSDDEAGEPSADGDDTGDESATESGATDDDSADPEPTDDPSEPAAE